MAQTLQSFIQMICDYLPYLRAPYAQRIFREQKLFGISGWAEKSVNETDSSKKNPIPGANVKSPVDFRQLWEKAQDFAEVLFLVLGSRKKGWKQTVTILLSGGNWMTEISFKRKLAEKSQDTVIIPWKKMKLWGILWIDPPPALNICH